MIIRHKTPRLSQYLDIKTADWQKRSCGIVSLAMLLARHGKKIRPEILLKKEITQAYLPGVGWKHKALADIGKKHGFHGRNFDWSGLSKKTAFQNLKKKLVRYPVIASIHHRFNPEKGGHLVVLTGMSDNRIFYNDPDAKVISAIQKTVSLKKFLVGWKKRIIIIYPK